MIDDWYENDITSIIAQKIQEMAEAMQLAKLSFSSLVDEIKELYEEIGISSESYAPISITDRVKARRPRNQIFLEKERRTRQYYPKQNRHARNIIRCR